MKHKMWSRLLSMMLAVMMIASIVPNSAFAEAASEIVASSQATVEVVEETEEVTLPEEEVPASEAPAEETPAVEPTAEPAPTEEPVVEPTAEPVTESEQPAAEPTQAPAETVAPSEEPSAEPTAAPEGTETPEGTAVPSETPAASATPAPSESPVPSETPAPSEEPAIDGQALLDELMAIEDDEAFLKAVSELTEEQTAALEALGEEALAEYTLRVEQIDLSKLLDELAAMDDDAFVEKFASLTDEEKAALNELNADVYAELEARYNLLTYVSPVFSVNGTQPVPFLQVGPLVENAGVPMTMMSRSAPMLRNSGTGTSEAEGIEVNKTATANDNGTYTLNLEAYATGDLEIVTESKPTDIVLVLDQSGSMADPFDYDYTYTYEHYTGHYLDSSNRPLYYLDGGEYYPVNVEVIRLDGWGERKFVYTYEKDGQVITIAEKDCWAWGWGWKWPFVDEGVNWINTKWNLYYQKSHSVEIERMEALKNSVTEFVNQVRKDAEENKVNHRLAIVGFASQTGYGNNTEVLTVEGDNSVWNQPSGTSGEPDMIGVAYNDANSDTYKTAMVDSKSDLVDHAIKALATNGATRADLGMEMAKKILEENPNNGERNQVVILFTDGEPTSGNSFEDRVANGAISQANAIKNSGATVYTIGIFNGANVNSSDDSNRYMQYVSSNYPNATSMGQHGTGDDAGGYYLVAQDAGGLSEIFEKISEEVGGSKSDLNEKAVLQDVISPYFEIVNDSNGKPMVTVSTATYTGEDTFTNDTSLDPSIRVNTSGDTVTVTGFDYKENYVGTEKDADGNVSYRGKKLMLSITIQPKEEFLGGNNVPTNVGPESGIYVDATESEPVKKFQEPSVNVDMKYEVTKNDKTIYLGNSASLLDLVNGSGYYEELGRGAHANDYADIVYDFGNGVTYTIKAQHQSGTWAGSAATVSPEECTTYSVSVKATPSIPVGTGSAKEDQTELSPEVHVVVPTVTWKDSTAQYGVALNDELFEDNFMNVQWISHQGTGDSCGLAPDVEGNAPELIYSYAAKDATDNTLATLTKEAQVKVSVKIGARDVTDAVKFGWEKDSKCTTCDDPNPGFQFRIHLGTGTLKITKTVSNWNDAKGDEATFLFRISGEGKTYYQAITVSKDTPTGDATFTLPAGTYTVTEEATAGYTCTSSSTVENVQVGGETKEVPFTNSTNGDNNPGDNGALNNWFKHEEGGWIWKLGGWNENVAG